MRKSETRDERSVSWKVLLPFCKSAKVLSIGMTEKELLGLTRTFNHVDTFPHNLRYDLAIFGDQRSTQLVNRCLSQMAVDGVLVTFGSSRVRNVFKRLSGWRCIGEYACLPSTGPRIFVPLALKCVRDMGLSFHPPGSLKGRTLLWGVKKLSSIGITAHLRRRTVEFFSRGSRLNGEGSLKEWISKRTGWSVAEMVVYAGSESLARKITVLGISSDYHEQIVAKMADTDRGSAAIKQESAALRALAQSPLSGSVPALIAEGEYGPYAIQLQSCLPKDYGQRGTLSIEHMRFLSTLSEINRASIPIHGTAAWHVFSDVVNSSGAGRLPEAIIRIASRLQNTGIIDRIVDCHMTHGDFAPWNIICKDNAILAYDWEDSSLSGFPFHDIFHFIYRHASLVGPWPGSASILKMMRDAAASLSLLSDIRCDIHDSLAVWCLAEYVRKPNSRLLELTNELARTVYA